jgi:hypothetical protein
LAYHLQIDADPDPDPDPDYLFDADPDPDPAFQFNADSCGSRNGITRLPEALKALCLSR